MLLYRYPTHVRGGVIGILLGSALLHPYASFFVFIGVYLCIALIVTEASLREKITVLVEAYFIKNALAIIWFWSVYPLDWLGAAYTSSATLIIIGIVWISVAGAMTIGSACIFLGLLTLQRKLQTAFTLYLIPIAFVAAEICGSFTFSLYSLGPGSVPNIDFGFGYLGYALSNWPPLFGIAAVAGVYGLTFFITLLCIALYTLIHKKQFHRYVPHALVSICIVLLLATNTLLTHRVTQRVPSIVTIDTNFQNTLLETTLGYQLKQDQLLLAVTEALTYSPEIIILPEDSRFSTTFASTTDVFTLLNKSETPVILIDSSRTSVSGEEATLRAFIYNTHTDTLTTFDKQYLVPLGEFVPYLFSFIENKLTHNTTDVLSDKINYRPGDRLQSVTTQQGLPWVLFCFESTSPLRLPKIAQNTPLVAHIVSHAWFNEPNIFLYQLHSMLRTQALWSNVPLIAASNMSPGYGITSTGTVLPKTLLKTSPFWTLYQF